MKTMKKKTYNRPDTSLVRPAGLRILADGDDMYQGVSGEGEGLGDAKRRLPLTAEQEDEEDFQEFSWNLWQ